MGRATRQTFDGCAAMSDHHWRVYVERFSSGWVNVTAPDEDTARDRARTKATRDYWYPKDDHALASDVERLVELDGAADHPRADSAEILSPEESSPGTRDTTSSSEPSS